MNKTAVKSFAVWARGELVAAVKQRAAEYGITRAGVRELAPGTLNREQEQLLAEIDSRGYERVMEEGACLWLIRLVALRLLEVNGLSPFGVGLFTDERGVFQPPVLTHALSLELEEPDKCKVQALWNRQDREGLYRYLLVLGCHHMSPVFPGLFERADHWTRLLVPGNLLCPEGVVGRMIAQLTEEDLGEMELLGWIYQFYMSDTHRAVVDPLHGKAIRKEDIPAATQVFTTDWVVRYLLDNSLGRYWLERHPESQLAEKLPYLVRPKEGWPQQEPIEPEALKVLDPCVGAGHFLSYAFDLLLQIYREQGWADAAAARSILENNLYGLDIDGRAVQLARFAVTLKAGKYDAGILKEPPSLHILAMADSDGITDDDIDTLAAAQDGLRRPLQQLRNAFHNAGEYGSILSAPGLDYAALQERLCRETGETAVRLLELARQAEILDGSYDVVVTNPPYLNKYSPHMKDYLTRHFAEYKGDLFSVFMIRNFALCKERGYCGFMTPMVWMFIKTYERLRRKLLSEKSLTTLIQFAYSAFEDATVPVCAFVLQNARVTGKALCFRLTAFPGGMQVQKQKVLEALEHPACGYFYEADPGGFTRIPTAPVAYWLSPKFLDIFANVTVGALAKPRQGLATGCNDRFLRRWYEVSQSKVCYDAGSLEEAAASGKKWFPYNKGGTYRKWYGNQEYLVNWEDDGALIRNFKAPDGTLRSRPQNTRYYFRESISWSLVSSGAVAFRYQPAGSIFDVAGMSCFADRHLLYLLGLCNSTVATEILAVLAPTINFQAGDIANIPVIIDPNRLQRVEALAQQNITLAKQDWDAFEISWDFRRHPLTEPVEDNTAGSVEARYRHWASQCDDRFQQMKANEEELNRVFLEIYGLQDELTPEVADQNITVRRADLRREIKSLLSYAVGCILGRYSHRIPGLLYAGGDWEAALTRLRTSEGTLPVEDNIVPVCEEAVDGDLASRIFQWVQAVYGEKNLEENLRFIAGALGGGGTPREVIRRYLCSGFYADHLKTYRNRPVYWMFSSGRHRGFQALIYMHRYQPDLPERMYRDYVLPELRMRKAHCAAGSRQKSRLSELSLFEEKLRDLADSSPTLDPDDGVEENYRKFQGVVTNLRGQ